MAPLVDVPIPPTWDAVTPAWLTGVLSPAFPGAVVGEAVLLASTEGTSRRARFELTYVAGSGPDVVFLKAEGSHREVHARNGNLFNEPLLYAAEIDLPIERPGAYAVVIDEPGLDWLAVFEDVTQRGGDPRDSLHPMTPAQVTRGALGLARLHRTYWGFTAADHPSLAWVRQWEPTEGFQFGLRRSTPGGLARGVGSLPAAVAGLSGDQVVDLWARYVALLGRTPTLLHADAHIGNTYVLDGSNVGFLDWAVCRRGHWSQDLGPFVQGSLEVADRRASERAILRSYLQELDRGIDFDEAWTWYRASAAYGLAIWLSTLGTDGYQPHEISLALAQRYAVAFDELDTVGALEALETHEPASTSA